MGTSGAALRRHSLPTLLGSSLTTLLGSSVGALVDRFRSPLATPIALSLSDGRQIHVVARFNWPVWASLSDAAERPWPGTAQRGHETP